ncbi:MAG: hypothetical protein QG603_276 [Patescibacteria group bacterium]|nr:hypothetical protein [Patescibacteria group bacterium]MDQ5970499.1 hypothetical protein [Patescibacteria group bacterium]
MYLDINIFTLSIFITNFFSHPFVLTIIVFILGNFVVNKIIPNKKEDVIKKIVDIKNFIKEVEFLYDRIVQTAQSIYEKKLPEELKMFKDELPKEVDKISTLVNEKIPIEKYKLDSEIEIYFKDKNLTKIYSQFSEEFSNIQTFLVYELPKDTDIFFKRLEHINNLDFKKLKSLEKNLITAITKAKSITFKPR